MLFKPGKQIKKERKNAVQAWCTDLANIKTSPYTVLAWPKKSPKPSLAKIRAGAPLLGVLGRTLCRCNLEHFFQARPGDLISCGQTIHN